MRIRPLCFALLGVCLLLGWSAPAHSQESKGQTYAFLVAASEYDEKELRPLQYSRGDIVEFYRELRLAGVLRKNIVLMHEKRPLRYAPETRKIREELTLLLAGLNKNDSLIVAFAGHGIQFRGDKRNYFCPVDARVNDKKTLIPMDEVYEDIEKCKARRKLLLVDACRNDPQTELSRSRLTVDLDSVTRPVPETLPQGIGALFSCSAGEKSFEHPDLHHGLFFHHILKGWRGDADVNKDNVVTLQELASYAQRETKDYARVKLGARQTPHAKIEFNDEWKLHGGLGRPYELPDAELKDLDAVLARLTKEIEEDPNDAYAYSTRAYVYNRKHDYNRAIADSNAAIRIDPHWGMAYGRRGWAHREIGDFDRAIADYSQAIQLDPKLMRTRAGLADAYANRGRLHLDKKDYDRTITDCNEAIRIDPNHGFAFARRGYAYDNKQDYDRAIEDYRQAIRLNPSLRKTHERLTNAYNSRGKIYLDKKEYNRAIAEFSEAIKLDPKSALAYRNRASAYRSVGKAKLAEADKQRAAELEKK